MTNSGHDKLYIISYITALLYILRPVVCDAEPITLDPVEIESEIVNSVPRPDWNQAEATVDFKRDSTGIRALSYEGLSGSHLNVAVSWREVTIPVHTWFDGTSDLRLYSAGIFEKVRLETRSSEFKTALLQLNSGSYGIYSQTGFNSLDNAHLEAGFTHDNVLFHTWGSTHQNRFRYSYDARDADFGELESKLGMVTGVSLSHDQYTLDMLSLIGYREARGGGVVEYPSASRDALSRTISQLTGMSLRQRGIQTGPWLWQPSLLLSNRLNYQDYSNPSPLAGRPVDQQYLDDQLSLNLKNDWIGLYPFDLSFHYTYRIFRDISDDPKLMHASEHNLQIVTNAEIPFIINDHYIRIAGNAGIDLSESQILPVAGLKLSYQYSEQIYTSASVRYFSRRPDYSEKYYISEHVKGDIHLKPEYGYHADIDFNLDLSSYIDILKFSLSGFLYNYKDAIHWVPVTSYMTIAQNLSDVTGYGGSIRIEAGHHFDHLKIKSHTGYHYTHLTTDHYDIPYTFRHRLNTDLWLTYDPISVCMSYAFYSNAKYGFSEVSVLPDRHIVDLSVQYQYGSVFFEIYIQNLLNDRTMSDSRQRPIPGMVSGFRVTAQP